MATPITPPTPSPIPAATTGPADGDLANAASVNVAFLDLMSGVLGLRLATYGRRANVHCSCINGTDIVVDALGSVILTTGGATSWISFLNSTAQTVVAATAFGAALGNNTRYYLYAYNNAGALDFIATTTAPNASRSYENGNTDRIYVTTFVTSGAGVIVPYVQDAQGVRYTTVGSNPTFGMNTGGAVWTDVNPNAVTPMVPSWARSIALSVILLNTSAVNDDFSLRAKGITAVGYTGASWAVQFGDVTLNSSSLYIPYIPLCTDTSQTFQYQWSTGGVGRIAAGFVAGWSY